jgi:hypothetical protein
MTSLTPFNPIRAIRFFETAGYGLNFSTRERQGLFRAYNRGFEYFTTVAHRQQAQREEKPQWSISRHDFES